MYGHSIRYHVQYYPTQPERIGDQQTRARILSFLQTHPGARLRQLCRALAAPRSTTEYHLFTLVRGERVWITSRGRIKHYFCGPPPGQTVAGQLVLQNRRPSEVFALIRSQPGIRQIEIRRRLDVSRKVLRGTLDSLIAHQLVVEEGGRRERHYAPTGLAAGLSVEALPASP
jgi:predicted transcriptional regulator